MSYIKEHKKSVIFGVVCALLLAAGLKGCLSEERPTYMTMSAFKGDIVKKVYATGTVAGQTQVDVGAQVSGQILKLYVKTGQDVKAGDLLCGIDPKIQETALQTAQASVDSIDNQITAKKAELKKLSLEYQRQKNLRKLDATSKQDAEFAEAEYDIAKASLADLNTQRKKAQLSVDDAQTKLSYTQIRAPIDGTVYATVVSEGQTVNAYQTTPTIMRLATMDKMKVLTEISEADVVNVEPGMECTFTILGKPFRIFRGVLQSIDPAPSDYQSSNNTTSSSSASSTQAIYYNSEISVDNEDRTLRIDMTADVVINIDERHDVLCLPLTAIRTLEDQDATVYVLDDDSKVVTRHIKVGLSDEKNAEVISGLTLDDRVVIGDDVQTAESDAMNNDGFGKHRRGPF